MNKFFTRLVAVAFGLTLVTSVASAGNRFPNASCPDSVTLPQINNPSFLPAICHPTAVTSGAPTDTVSGLGGIIIGFDTIPTGFDAFIENRGNPVQPWSGIDVFMHGTNFKPIMGLNLGDSLVVEFAGVANFAGDIEVEAPNNNFSGPNIILRRASVGNPLPAIISGTTTQFKETPTNAFAEQYKCQLVSITGPLTVVRTSLQVPNIGTSNSFLCISASAPSDSVFIEGNKLTTYAPPALGTVIDYVQGIMLKATRGFRILLRSGNDIQTHTPPGVADAYPLTDNTVRVIFDRDVTAATATNTNNYSLASFGSVDGAVMDGTGAVVLTINNGLNHGDAETVTVNNIAGSANGLVMNTPTSKGIINGVLTCAEIQAPNADSLGGATCIDKSRFAGGGGQTSQGALGAKLSMAAICTGIYGNIYNFEDVGAGVRSGMTIFAPPAPMVVGHKYFLAGNVQGFFGETELSGISDVRDQGAATVPDAAVKTVAVIAKDVCDATQTVDSGKDYMSMLVQFHSVKRIIKLNPVDNTPLVTVNGFHVAGPNPAFTDTIFIENENNVLGTFVANNPNYPAVGSVMDVVGCVHYTNSSFRVCPRTASDISVHGINVGVPTAPAKLAFSVYPNPSRVAKISFTLPSVSDVELGVYDVTGRQVASLAKGRMPAGSYSQAWSGKDASGKQVGAGVYFYRLKAGNEVRTARTTLLGN
jgi:hypothetical protein